MTSRGALLVALVLVTAGLAGCVGGDGSGGENVSPTAGSQGSGQAAADGRGARASPSAGGADGFAASASGGSRSSGGSGAGASGDAGSAEDGASPSLLVYGPGDAFLARLGADGEGGGSGPGAIDASLPAGTGGGSNAYVLVAPATGPAVELATNASGASASSLELTPLPLATQQGSEQTVRGPQAVTRSFQPDRRPLAVGIYLTNEQPIAAGADEGTGQLTGPNGQLLQGEMGCGLCLTGSYYAELVTPIGDEGVVAGSYQASYEPGVEAGFSVGHFLVSYERS